MKKVLIIGAKGNLGSALTEAYAGAEPVLFDRDELDITDQEQCMQTIAELKPEVVYNCAAYNHVDNAETEVEAADTLNGYAVGNLARACKLAGAVLVHFSSNYVFDGGRAEGYNEDDKPTPLNAYGRSKRLGEIELEQNTEEYYLVRTAWLYGGRGTNGKKSFVEIMLDLTSEGKSIDCVNDEFGQPTYSKDLAQALVSLTEEQKPFGTYHLTNSGMASWFDWAQAVFQNRNMEVAITPISSIKLNRPARRPKYGILNNTKFMELRPWSEALNEYLTSK